jgi:hypothetical protein
MKRSLISLLSLMLLMTVVVIGCSDDDDDNPAGSNTATFPTDLAGTWEQQSVSFNGVSQDIATFFDWDTSAIKATITMFTDYTHRYEELDAQDSILYYDEGTLTLDGQNVTVVVTSENGQAITPDTTCVGTWAVVGNLLTITQIRAADTVIMVLDK